MTQNIYKNIPQLFLSYREPYFGKEKYQHKKFETFSDKDKLLLEGEHTPLPSNQLRPDLFKHIWALKVNCN